MRACLAYPGRVENTQTIAYDLGSWLVERRKHGSFVKPEPRMLLIDQNSITLETFHLTEGH